MIYFLISILISVLSALIAKKLKIPAYLLVGGILGVAIFNIFTNKAYSPGFNKFFLQVVSGSFIGSTINSKELKNLKYIVYPSVFMIIGMSIVNIFMGSLIHLLTKIDYLTLLLSTIPGGVTETVLVAQAMDANISIVAVMQLFRSVVSLIIFPIVINWIIQKDNNCRVEVKTNIEEKKEKNLIITLIIGCIGGLFGYLFSFVPASQMVFSLIFVSIFNLFTDKATVSLDFKKMAQISTGVFVGSKVSLDTVKYLHNIFIPVVLMLLGYLVFHILLALLISKITKIDKDIMLFSCIPAGASDIALIAASFNCNSPYIAIFQIARLISCILIYPYIDLFISTLFF
ncbi:MAG: AbrB family transcriptional regulator [Spirochaetales bacterium]|nr:AbrB family transcriptional regulator [Spirochaetales bacterium]